VLELEVKAKLFAVGRVDRLEYAANILPFPDVGACAVLF
jgi:hypothetical protein